MIDKVCIKGLVPASQGALGVPQLTTVGKRARVFRVLFVATDHAGGTIMLAYVGRGVANNLIAAGAAEEFTG